MAVRATGIKINDRELKKFADRLTEKYVDISLLAIKHKGKFEKSLLWNGLLIVKAQW